MVQLIHAISYLHSHKIAHRDLKMENVLLFSNNVVKISDYGFCKQVIYLFFLNIFRVMIYRKLFVVQNPTQRPKFSKESFMIRLKPIFGKFILKKYA